MESILSSASAAKSPVDGESWPALSPAYKKHKIAEGLPGKANLEEEGDMLDSLTFEDSSSGIELGWFGKEAAKADGHNNLSGDSRIPTRRVLPDVGQEFTPAIQKGAEQIIADALSDSIDFDPADFEAVTTKSDLYSTLNEYFPDMSRAEIRSTITRSPSLVSFLDDQGLFDLL